MKRESRTVDRSDQVDSPTQRHLPLVDLLVDTRAELMELAVASGLKVLTTMLEDGSDGHLRPAVSASGRAAGVARRARCASEVVLGGRKVQIRRPRVRADGARGRRCRRFRRSPTTDPLNRRVVEQMLVGVATRQYAPQPRTVAGDG